MKGGDPAQRRSEGGADRPTGRPMLRVGMGGRGAVSAYAPGNWRFAKAETPSRLESGRRGPLTAKTKGATQTARIRERGRPQRAAYRASTPNGPRAAYPPPRLPHGPPAPRPPRRTHLLLPLPRRSPPPPPPPPGAERVGGGEGGVRPPGPERGATRRGRQGAPPLPQPHGAAAIAPALPRAKGPRCARPRCPPGGPCAARRWWRRRGRERERKWRRRHDGGGVGFDACEALSSKQVVCKVLYNPGRSVIQPNYLIQVNSSRLSAVLCCAACAAWLFALSWAARTLGCRINKHGQLMVAEELVGSAHSVSAMRPSS